MNIGRPLDRETNHKIIHDISMIAFNNVYNAFNKPIFNVLRNTIYTSLSTLTNNNYGLRR